MLVATPTAPGMLPMPRPHPQQVHMPNTAQFQQRKTSASSAPQGQSLLGGPAYQVIDRQHLPGGTIHRQLSGEGSSPSGKPPPGLSLPIRPTVMGDQGTTPTPPGMVMAGLDQVNRSGHALANTPPMTVATGYATLRPPHHVPELSLYGAPPKVPANVNAGGNKRALLPTPQAATTIPPQLGFLSGNAHHHIATPNPSVPPGWPGGNIRVPPQRHPPTAAVTNPSSSVHRQPVLHTQEQQQHQQVQRSNYPGGNYSRGNGGPGI